MKRTSRHTIKEEYDNDSEDDGIIKDDNKKRHKKGKKNDSINETIADYYGKKILTINYVFQGKRILVQMKGIKNNLRNFLILSKKLNKIFPNSK